MGSKLFRVEGLVGRSRISENHEALVAPAGNRTCIFSLGNRVSATFSETSMNAGDFTVARWEYI
jgi:hypothetical protein